MYKYHKPVDVWALDKLVHTGTFRYCEITISKC